MKTKFTQGTWKVEMLTPKYGAKYPCVTSNGQLVSSCDTGTDEEIEANAKLISASPKLLKAAQTCQTISDRCNNAMLPPHIQELLKSINDTLSEAINEAI